MKYVTVSLLLVLALAAGMLVGRKTAQQSFAGVDESVVRKLAAEQGRQASAPLINTDQGDLLLFVFLIAGLTGGFVGGAYFQKLFGRQPEREHSARMTNGQ